MSNTYSVYRVFGPTDIDCDNRNASPPRYAGLGTVTTSAFPILGAIQLVVWIHALDAARRPTPKSNSTIFSSATSAANLVLQVSNSGITSTGDVREWFDDNTTAAVSNFAQKWIPDTVNSGAVTMPYDNTTSATDGSGGSPGGYLFAKSQSGVAAPQISGLFPCMYRWGRLKMLYLEQAAERYIDGLTIQVGVFRHPGWESMLDFDQQVTCGSLWRNYRDSIPFTFSSSSVTLTPHASFVNRAKLIPVGARVLGTGIGTSANEAERGTYVTAVNASTGVVTVYSNTYAASTSYTDDQGNSITGTLLTFQY